MKRFFLFAFLGEPQGGMDDFEESFDTIEEAVEHFDGCNYDFGNVLDSEESLVAYLPIGTKRTGTLDMSGPAPQVVYNEDEQEEMDWYELVSEDTDLDDEEEDHAWIFELQNGDEITWTHPDTLEEIMYLVSTVEYVGDKGPGCVLRITTISGVRLQCFAREIS